MKRRVLRAHANKRCLRILSAAHLIQAPASSRSSSAIDGDRGYAILCDASFLRAVLLSYWQANATATWREARRRKLRRAASSAHGGDVMRTASPPADPAPCATDRNAAALAASIARLPLGALPQVTPHAFLMALLCEAFQAEDRSPTVIGHPAKAAMAHVDAALASRFHLYCLPETVATLHRMRASVPTPPACATASPSASLSSPTAITASGANVQGRKDDTHLKHKVLSGSAAQPNTPQAEPRHRINETEAWLAASFGDLAARGDNISNTTTTHHHIRDGGAAHRRGGPPDSSTTFPITFSEVPAAVVDRLLGCVTLIAPGERPPQQHRHSDASDSHGVSDSTEKMEAIVPLPTRNEARAIGEFMIANDIRLGRLSPESASSTVAADASACDLSALRLVSMPSFTDFKEFVLSPHSAAAKRRRRKENRNVLGRDGGDDPLGQLQGPAHGSIAFAHDGLEKRFRVTKSRSFVPRAFFVATQSHDVRRRLAAVTPLLRLTTNPDALWIEQRGAAYSYGEDGVGASRLREEKRAAEKRRTSSAPDAAPSTPGSGKRQCASDMLQIGSFSRTPSPQHAFSTTTTTTTVVAAAPKLSRADVAFMKHLGTAVDVPLPEKSFHHPHPAPALSGGVGNKAPGGRRRPRQRGQNPLSMKKRHKREVFRAD